MANWLSRMAQRVLHKATVPGRVAVVPSCGESSASVHIDFARTPPQHWVDAVEALAPLSDRMAGLTLRWEAGDRWQPIHRWVIWQLQPWAFVKDRDIKRELRGPHPRTNARLVYVNATVNGQTMPRPRLQGGPCRFIDRRTWEIHQEYAARGILVRPVRFWVLQGSEGGHPFMVSPEEQRLRAAQGLPADTPSAGDLPYAGYDARVADGIRRYDLWQWAHGGEPHTAAVKATVARMNETEIAANRLRWQQWEAFGQEHASAFAHAARQDGLHRLRLTPVGHKARPVDYQQYADAYINDTTVETVA